MIHGFKTKLYFIRAVVPRPELALKEACRALKPDGKIYMLDKFIRHCQLAIIRRVLNIFIRHIATRTDVVFEKTLEHCQELNCLSDKPALAGGWLRLLELEKR